MLVASALVTSCLNESPNSIMNINYMGVANPDSMTFTVPGDSVWKDNIIEAATKLGVINTPFAVLDTVPVSDQIYATQHCDLKAAKEYNSMQKKLTLSEIKKTIYNAHADSLVNLGYNEGAEALPIHEFLFHSSLYSFYTTQRIFYYPTRVR